MNIEPQAKPELLSDELVAKVEAACNHGYSIAPGTGAALCQTVRAAWVQIAELTTHWCKCGHAKDKHGFFSDHDECYECDQASPDLCCEWRPAPRRNERDAIAALRDQLAELQRRNDTQSESIKEFQAEEKALKARLAQAEADNERLALAMQGIEEREAAVCPEDVGFDEYIRTLQRQVAARPQAGYPWTGNEP